MIKKLLLLVICICGYVPILAQLNLPSGSRVGAVRPFNEYVLSDWMQKASNEYQNIEGSPFLNRNWEKGTIHTINDEIFEDVMLKLNLYDGQLIHFNNFTGDSSVIRDDMLWSFSLSHRDSVYTFERFDQTETPKSPGLNDFFIVLYRDTLSLLAKPVVKLQRSTDNALITSTGKQNDRFVTHTQYYLLTPTNELVLLKNSRKGFKEAFGNHYKACRELLNNRGLDWKNPQDLVVLIEFYNRLP